MANTRSKLAKDCKEAERDLCRVRAKLESRIEKILVEVERKLRKRVELHKKNCKRCKSYPDPNKITSFHITSDLNVKDVARKMAEAADKRRAERRATAVPEGR